MSFVTTNNPVQQSSVTGVVSDENSPLRFYSVTESPQPSVDAIMAKIDRNFEEFKSIVTSWRFPLTGNDVFNLRQKSYDSDWNIAISKLEHTLQWEPKQLRDQTRYVYDMLASTTDDATTRGNHRRETLTNFVEKLMSFCNDIMPDISVWDEVWTTDDGQKMKEFWTRSVKLLVESYRDMFNAMSATNGSSTRCILKFIEMEGDFICEVHGLIYDAETFIPRVPDVKIEVKLVEKQREDRFSSIYDWTRPCVRSLPEISKITKYDYEQRKQWSNTSGSSNYFTPFYLQRH